MNIAEKYWNGLKKAYYANGAKEKWEHFKDVVHGVTEENKKELIKNILKFQMPYYNY